MSYPLSLLTQIAAGFAKEFGTNCEIVIHDLLAQNLESSIVHIENGHVTNRQIGDGPSKIVLKAADVLKKNPDSLTDQLGYLTRTANGKILKSSTMYIKDETNSVRYMLSINYDITGLIHFEQAIKSLVQPEQPQDSEQPEQIITNVTDLLDNLIEQSVSLVGKPAALMNKEEKIKAIQFLNDAGAFLITKSGDKVSKYFGISKFTLYSYIDVNGKPKSGEDNERKKVKGEEEHEPTNTMDRQPDAQE